MSMRVNYSWLKPNRFCRNTGALDCYHLLDMRHAELVPIAPSLIFKALEPSQKDKDGDYLITEIFVA